MLISGKKFKKFTGFLNYGPEEKGDIFNLLSTDAKDMSVKETFTKEYLDLNKGKQSLKVKQYIKHICIIYRSRSLTLLPNTC